MSTRPLYAAWGKVAVWAVLVLATPFYATSASAAEFKVKVGVEGGAQEDLSCRSMVGQKSLYNTRTLTTTHKEMWSCKDAGACDRNEWSVEYQRDDKGSATAGRCATKLNETISGNGVFSARLYLHKDIKDSSGVYTIAIRSVPFTVKEELDLVVVNLADNLVKFGAPGRAASLPMDQIMDKWLTVSMRKKGTSCHLTIQPDQGKIIDLGNIHCNINDESNMIVVNARARNSSKMGRGTMTISSVSWVRDAVQPSESKSIQKKNN